MDLKSSWGIPCTEMFWLTSTRLTMSRDENICICKLCTAWSPLGVAYFTASTYYENGFDGVKRC